MVFWLPGWPGRCNPIEGHHRSRMRAWGKQRLEGILGERGGLQDGDKNKCGGEWMREKWRQEGDLITVGSKGDKDRDKRELRHCTRKHRQSCSLQVEESVQLRCRLPLWMNVVIVNCCVMIHAVHESASEEAVITLRCIINSREGTSSQAFFFFLFVLCVASWTEGRDTRQFALCRLCSKNRALWIMLNALSIVNKS